jgi:SecD/SecF fusion protein
MVAVQATFTLAGLAGLVLMLGMAVDANVLIYERLREERDRGASLALALRNGYERALPTIIDTHLTQIFTAIVLYAVGNDQLKGFGISLTVGLIISLFTSLFMTRVMFDLWAANGWLHKLSMMRLLSNPNINFMGIRNYVFAGTVAFTVFGLALFLARTPNDLDIDFKGGTAMTAQLTKAKGIDGLRELLGDKQQAKMLQVADVKEVGGDGREYSITYRNSDGSKSEPYKVTLVNKVPGTTARDREDKVREDASKLPDWSVEQLFTSQELQEGKGKGKAAQEAAETWFTQLVTILNPISTSRGVEGQETFATKLFTVRTSEKEREVVSAILDRLLREENKSGQSESLLHQVKMTEVDDARLSEKKPVALFKFDDYASPSYAKMLFDRELKRHFAVDESTGRLEVRYELVGEGNVQAGKFKILKVTFEPLTPAQSEKVKVALRDARESFNQRPQPERLENFDSELAADTRLRAMGAIVASWLAAILYLWFRFGNWTFGLAAVLCLIHDLCFTLGFIALSYWLQAIPVLGPFLQINDFKIDLNGVAALLTLAGYSTGDTIVVFDRIREVRGKNPDLTPQIINDSINQTLSRTVLTSGTCFIVVVILYFLGGPGVHLFAFIMSVGVVVGTLSSIYVASPLLLILGEGRHKERLRDRRPQQAATTV